MPNYRRALIPGGTWFFTVNLADRRSTALVDNVDQLQRAIRWTKRRHAFRIECLVILPDHLHAVLTLPEGDADFPLRWRLIKQHFSKAMPNVETRSASRTARGERGIWQRRYWEHCIRDDEDLNVHVDYYYFNPIKHGLVANVRDWPHSTYRRDVRAGRIEGGFARRDAAIRNFGEQT